MPSREQVERAVAVVEELRARHHGHIVIDAVVPWHRHAAERLRGAHCPVEARPVRADDGDLVVPREPELGERRPGLR
jgi:hypothetical protein